MHSTEQLLSFHVYRVGGCLGDDKVIKAQDKVTVKYYLKVSRGDAHWQFTLHPGGSNGPLIYRVSSGYVGPPLIYDLSPVPILVNIASERHPIYIERRQGAPKDTQWFRGPDDNDYQWRSSARLWRNSMQCLNAKGEIVAAYRVITMAMCKDGELSIYPPGLFMTDLLVATSLAIRTPDY